MAYTAGTFPVAKLNPDTAPVVSGFRCLVIYVPDNDNYAQIAAMLLAKMTDSGSWGGTAEENEVRALMCLDAYLLADWESVCP